MTGGSSRRALIRRLAEAVRRDLIPTAEDASVRARLHALAAVLDNLTTGPASESADEARSGLRRAMQRGDEEEVVSLARHIATRERAEIVPVDWTAASRGDA